MSYIDRFNPDRLDKFVVPSSGDDPYFVKEVVDKRGQKSFDDPDILLDDTKKAVVEFTEENFEKACASYFEKLRADGLKIFGPPPDQETQIDLSKPKKKRLIQNIIDVWDIIDDLQEHDDEEIGEIFISAMLDDDPLPIIVEIEQTPGHEELLFCLNNEKHFRAKIRYLATITDSNVKDDLMQQCGPFARETLRTTLKW